MVVHSLDKERARLIALWNVTTPDMAAIEAAQNEYLAAKAAIISAIQPRHVAVERASQPPPPTCVHRGNPKSKVKVQCKGCGGKQAIIEYLSFECAIHGRCLPYFRGPWGEAQQGEESEMYHLCHGCDEKELPPC